MRGWTRMTCALSLACAAACAGWTPPARAADAGVAWPTFFRLGPGKQYRVVDELARGVTLDVLACNDQWCQARLGRVVGYVERAALDPGTLAASRPADGQGCFSSRRAGYGAGEEFRYCPR